MKGLLVVAGLAAAVAVVSGALLLAAPRSGEGPPGNPDGGPGRGAGGSGLPGVFPGAADPGNPPEVEKRLRVLEVRLEEIQGQLLLLGGSAASWTPGEDGGEGVLSIVPGAAGGGDPAGPSPGEEAARDGGRDGGDGDGSDGADPARVEAAARASDLRKRAAELRKELEIQRRIEQMTASMDLQPVEKERLEEIVRNHVARTGEVGVRARELLKDSGFGLAPGDRATLEQVMADRKALDRETESSILALVGADRWKTFRKSVKDQNDKERALRRLGQPW